MINPPLESPQEIEASLLLEELFTIVVKDGITSDHHCLISDAVYARFLQCYGEELGASIKARANEVSDSLQPRDSLST